MALCTICSEPGHNKTRHIINCVICGSTKTIEDVSDAEAVRVQKETYECTDLQFHQTIRNAWNLPRDDARRLLSPPRPS